MDFLGIGAIEKNIIIVIINFITDIGTIGSSEEIPNFVSRARPCGFPIPLATTYKCFKIRINSITALSHFFTLWPRRKVLYTSPVVLSSITFTK